MGQHVLLPRPVSPGPRAQLPDDVPLTPFERLVVAAKNLVGGATGLVDPFSGPDAPRAAAVGAALSALVPVLSMARGVKAAKGVTSAEQAVQKGITAYHGSPHSFDKFSLEKIGTGEGAQAYGHGLYFAESPEVAEQYRKALASQNVIDTRAKALIDKNGGDIEKGVDELLRSYYDTPKAKAKMRAEMIANYRSKAPTGTTYQVKINASPDQFLDYDKTLSEQSDAVKQSLAKLQEKYRASQGTEGPYLSPSSTGKQALEEVVNVTDAGKRGSMTYAERRAAASQLLKNQGIPGIKYLDGMSRSSGEGSLNYVVFDDALVTILKKYGVALPALGMLERYAKEHNGTIPASLVETLMKGA